MTTYITSAQPALKRNLFTALQNRPGLTDVQVTYGFPKSPTKEFMWLGDIHDDGEETAGFGASDRPKNENFSLQVIVKVEKQTTDQQLATDRAYELVAELEQQLRSDPTVAGAGVLWALVAGKGLAEFANDQTRMAIVTVRVKCKARL